LEDNFEIRYPKKGDKLVVHVGEKRLFSGWMVGQWRWYPDAYKEAADKLVDQIEGHSWEDGLVFPVVFLYRHYVELKLKYLIIEFDMLGGTVISDKEFNRHELVPLWNYVKGHIGCISGAVWDKEILRSLESLIKELDQLDPNSYRFRYSHDIKFQANPLPDSISLGHFKEGMAIIEAGFGYIDGGIDMETEGRSQEAAAYADYY